MTTLTIVLIVLTAMVLAFLFSPVTIVIDSHAHRYEFSHRPVFRFFIRLEQDSIAPVLTIMGLRIPIRKKASQKKVARKPKSNASSNKSMSAWRFLVTKTLGSIVVKRAVVDVDTDDVVLNAQLFPVCYWASQGAVRLSTNFEGKVAVDFKASAVPARLIWIIIQFSLKK